MNKVNSFLLSKQMQLYSLMMFCPLYFLFSSQFLGSRSRSPFGIDFEMSLRPWGTAASVRRGETDSLCFGSIFVTGLVCWLRRVKKYKLGFPYGGVFFYGEASVKPITKKNKNKIIWLFFKIFFY